MNKSHLGILRWLHFLALAYLMYRLCHWRAGWFTTALPRAIVTMGQQSLPIFLSSMVLSYAGGIVLDRLGRELPMAVALVNLTGMALLLIVGQVMAWLDTKPWKYLPAKGLAQRDIPHDLEQFSVGYRWGRQALALPLMIGLAAFPALLTNQPRLEPIASDLVVQTTTPDIEAVHPVEVISPETEADKLIDSQQQL